MHRIQTSFLMSPVCLTTISLHKHCTCSQEREEWKGILSSSTFPQNPSLLQCLTSQIRAFTNTKSNILFGSMLSLSPEVKIQIIYMMEINVFKIIKLNLMISKPITLFLVGEYMVVYSTLYFLHKMFFLYSVVFSYQSLLLFA